MTKRMSATRLAKESVVESGSKQRGISAVVLPGWGGAATMKPQLASPRVKNGDCPGKPHEPWEKRMRGQRPRSTVASPPEVAVSRAGNQMEVSRRRGSPVVSDAL